MGIAARDFGTGPVLDSGLAALDMGWDTVRFLRSGMDSVRRTMASDTGVIRIAPTVATVMEAAMGTTGTDMETALPINPFASISRSVMDTPV